MKYLNAYLFASVVEILGATESEGKGFSKGLWVSESKVAQPLINKRKVFKRIFVKMLKLNNSC